MSIRHQEPACRATVEPRHAPCSALISRPPYLRLSLLQCARHRQKPARFSHPPPPTPGEPPFVEGSPCGTPRGPGLQTPHSPTRTAPHPPSLLLSEAHPLLWRRRGRGGGGLGWGRRGRPRSRGPNGSPHLSPTPTGGRERGRGSERCCRMHPGRGELLCRCHMWRLGAAAAGGEEHHKKTAMKEGTGRCRARVHFEVD